MYTLGVADGCLLFVPSLLAAAFVFGMADMALCRTVVVLVVVVGSFWHCCARERERMSEGRLCLW